MVRPTSRDATSRRQPWLDPATRRTALATLITIPANLLLLIVLASLWHHMPVAPAKTFEPNFESSFHEPYETPVEEMTLAFTTPETPIGLPLEPDVQAFPTLLPDAAEIFAVTPGDPVVTLEIPALPPGDKPAAVASQSSHSPQSTVPSAAQMLTATDLKVGGGYEGRLTAAARDRLAGARGGSPASERAVQLGLAWLAAHQRSDGGWSFDLKGTPCAGQCSHAGTHQSTTAATALALLAYLGAGQTHRSGEYQTVVDRGLEYLCSRIVPSSRGADLQEGTMYAQGLATLALCEAYALTSDRELQKPAQQAIDFIVNVQHPLGGWRYFPGQPGDTTVLGWQLMALQSGKLAGLQIPEYTVPRAHEFLDRVQGEQGATYGYQTSGDQATPSAVGLLCRMYHGWPRSDERLKLGIERLAARGPDLHDLYFTYYATQALHHFDGPQWEAWNKRLRDRLVALQVKEGHEAGSWYTPDYHTVSGGRLCDTALAVMILEVYYRHMPLYGYRGIEDFW
ncbi:prenyltransferase/squalene oxidase repeat-containing protein [Anatilimnocola floriformis]|uniref:prenyltransferase/squalene oxidase repeat-containing protein n=1 Tax=Anatilimnocola floriformis TaxID=2948575 RepID=UPI0020C1CAF8|nr:prenyltransferase/squalene oxidase repeat-containing protein [Anatilimnocola floriformis]